MKFAPNASRSLAAKLDLPIPPCPTSTSIFRGVSGVSNSSLSCCNNSSRPTHTGTGRIASIPNNFFSLVGARLGETATPDLSSTPLEVIAPKVCQKLIESPDELVRNRCRNVQSLGSFLNSSLIKASKFLLLSHFPGGF